MKVRVKATSINGQKAIINIIRTRQCISAAV